MDSALGRVGRILKVDPDGDINVKCPGGLTWYFNPDCVEPVSDEDNDYDNLDYDEDVPFGLDCIIRDLFGVEPNGGGRNGAKTKPKMTPLHSACHAGNKFLVKMMAMTGTKLNDGDKDGDTALHYAVYGSFSDSPYSRQLTKCEAANFATPMPTRVCQCVIVRSHYQ